MLSAGANQASNHASQATTVLHVRVVSGTGGGPEKTILNSQRFLDSAAYRLLCAYLYPPADEGFQSIREKARFYSANLVEVPDRGPFDLRVARDLLRVCRREKVAIWHAHDYKSNVLGLILRPFWRMRLVTTVHGWVKYSPLLNRYYGIDRLALRYYERVVCVSEDLRDQCTSAGVSPHKCLVVPNAIDTKEFSRRQASAEAKRRLGIATDRFVVGAVGRLSEEKGFDRLILAADQLMRNGLDLHVCILGEGDARAQLEQLIARLDRRDRIQLAGYQSNAIDWYDAMDVFALSSLREGTPNVLLEAMALEVPIVATRIAGVPKLIEDGVNGLLVEPDDVDSLAQSLAAVANDGELRRRLARSARETVETQHSFAFRMQRMRNVYDELLGRSPEVLAPISTKVCPANGSLQAPAAH